MVANVARLGPDPDDPLRRPRCTSILLLRDDRDPDPGWRSSQFNCVTSDPPWSAFVRPGRTSKQGWLSLHSTADDLGVELDLQRTSRPCTSQCAPFAGDHHLRWQSEPGVRAHGRWRIGDRIHQSVEAIGYHERVRGRWGWPELGGWVFGFTNDPGAREGAPASAMVFTLIQPRDGRNATGSIMLWDRGRLVRHFPRRRVTVAVQGELPADRVRIVPHLARLFGVPPMAPVPRRLVIHGAMGPDRVVLDFQATEAARVCIPSETSVHPFSVHEVTGPCRLEGVIGGRRLAFDSHGIVEFAGGAHGP